MLLFAVVSIGQPVAAQSPNSKPKQASATTEASTSAATGAGVEVAGLEDADRELIGQPPDLDQLVGRPIRAVSIERIGKMWGGKAATAKPPKLASVRIGQPLTGAMARQALRQLLETGRFAQASVDARPYQDGVILRFVVIPRRIVATLKLTGGTLDQELTYDRAGLSEGMEITEAMFDDIKGKIRRLYRRRGYDTTTVDLEPSDTDDPMGVVLTVHIEPGPRRTISRRIFVIRPLYDPQVGDLKSDYEVETGDPLDQPALNQADQDLSDELRAAGFLRARVTHRVLRRGAYTFLYIYLDTGPKLRFRFIGNRSFDDSELLKALDLETRGEANPSQLANRLQEFYALRSFYDAGITGVEYGGPQDAIHEVRFRIWEGIPVRVVKRIFPCFPENAEHLDLSEDDLNKEIDGILKQTLPGASFITAVDPAAANLQFGQQPRSSRPPSVRLEPAESYTPEAYDKALKHLRKLLSSKGYLNALVGPVTLLRAECNTYAPGEGCSPLPLPPVPKPLCRTDAVNLPLAEPELDDKFTCEADRRKSIRCAPGVTVSIPIQLGPQTTLYDLVFEGNEQLDSRDLSKIAALKLGDPLSNLELDAARVRVLTKYRNEGFAYATVRSNVEHSPDRTRARARFTITERQPVIIREYEVRGAIRTDPDLIISRLALCQELTECTPDEKRYRQNLVRESEEQIATLGVFSSVSIGMEDPEIPQHHKRVIITVVEQRPQYLEPRIGFATGEGFRFAMEYGHRNVAGQAIALTVRLELSILPDLLIMDSGVLEHYSKFSVSERLERRNSVSVRFPEVGLGPKVNITVDGIDVRDNQRDYSLTRDALMPALNYQPVRTLHLQLSPSLEVNDVTLFAADDIDTAITSNPDLANKLRVPQGRTMALAQRIGITWDRRDTPFAATRGTYVSTGMEHVYAFPLDDSADITSHFLRFTGRAAGYLRLTNGGLALAVSVAGGYNFQLREDSQTYPDRLFYVGGVDTIRG